MSRRRRLWRLKRRIFPGRYIAGPYGRFRAPRWSPPVLRKGPGYLALYALGRYRTLAERGPRWRQAWGRKWYNAWTRKTSNSFLRRIRAGRFQTAPAVAVELLLECEGYRRLTAHQQVAALRDVARHYGPGRAR